MMFTFAITTPAQTPKTNQTKLELPLRAGVITKISVLIPPGHQALAHMAIFDGETQIMPWGKDQWIEGNGESIPWEPDYELPSEPARLEARAWNEDDTYSHTFFIRIWVDPGKSKPDWNKIEAGMEAIAKFVERVLGTI
jgi:hypothetical protein